jgi:hypothetical protein
MGASHRPLAGGGESRRPKVVSKYAKATHPPKKTTEAQRHRGSTEGLSESVTTTKAQRHEGRPPAHTKRRTLSMKGSASIPSRLWVGGHTLPID